MKVALVIITTLFGAISGTNLRPRGQNSRIIGGEDAYQGQFPFMVSLARPGAGHECGGSLIGPNKVLSSASCANIATTAYVNCLRPNSFVSEALDPSNPCQNLPIHRQIVYPGFDSATRQGDVMIIHLVGEVNDPHFIAIGGPAKESFLPIGTEVIYTGYGSTSTWGVLGLPSDILQVAKAQVIPDSVCDEPYSAWWENSVNLCLKRGTYESTCVLDDGGPYFIQCNQDTDKFLQVGIISWGGTCNSGSAPSVATEIADRSILKFIIRYAPETKVYESAEDFCQEV